MIAEEIIKGYLRIRDFLKDSRNQYLKAKTRRQKAAIKQSTSATDIKQCNTAQKVINKRKAQIYSRYVGHSECRLEMS